MATPLAHKVDEVISGLGAKVVELSQNKWMKLAISILIDIIGILSYIIPVVRPARPHSENYHLTRLAIGQQF
jgi:hypothetical protein